MRVPHLSKGLTSCIFQAVTVVTQNRNLRHNVTVVTRQPPVFPAYLQRLSPFCDTSQSLTTPSLRGVTEQDKERGWSGIGSGFYWRSWAAGLASIISLFPIFSRITFGGRAIRTIHDEAISDGKPIWPAKIARRLIIDIRINRK